MAAMTEEDEPSHGLPRSLQTCRPARGVHFHGDGERCECGETPNVYDLGGAA